MTERPFRIGIVAPAGRMDEGAAARVTQLAAATYGGRVELQFHPQCFLSRGHFAGSDRERADAFVEFANDASVDAIWFARGGYGSFRIVGDAVPQLNGVARRKLFVGYSDLGSLLGALHVQSFPYVAHGPMPADILRPGGEAAVSRALKFMVERADEVVDPVAREGGPCLAFNMTILSRLIGTPHIPDLRGHVVMLEEVSEYIYGIDRTLGQIMSSAAIRGVAGIRLGRCTLIPPNEPEFGMSEVEVMQHWCSRAGIPYLGRADIGHDVENKVVPFGNLNDFRLIS